MPECVSRRDPLETGAVATAGALVARPEPAAARALQADVVVVGAGYAGLGAAWELFKHGKPDDMSWSAPGPDYSPFSSAVQSGKRAAAEVLAAG